MKHARLIAPIWCLAVIFDVKAQVCEWNRHPIPTPRYKHATVWDEHRGELLLFGGSDWGHRNGETWAWNGARWTLHGDAGPPSVEHSLAYDSARGVVVMFTWFETWEWDGDDWSLKSSSGPPARTEQAMAYDARRGVTVLFGGRNSSRYYEDTWEWDGAQWIQRAASGPARRSQTAMVYDEARGVTVLFGGYDQDGPDWFNSDTWEWDGSDWSLRSTEGPSPRHSHAMAYDRDRRKVVLYGGHVGDSPRFETWEWDGNEWALRGTTGPPSDFDSAMAYDPVRGATLCFGGLLNSDRGPTAEFWSWDGEMWSLVADNAAPLPRSGAALAYDSHREISVLFGGREGFYGDETHSTWEWNGSVWRKGSDDDPWRFDHATAYDASRHVVVMFGGRASTLQYIPPSKQTWLWDGSAWTLVATTGPSGRWAHAMAYDGRREVTVLFGGIDADWKRNGETWEWDGEKWTRRTPAHSPGARWAHAMAYDERRGVTVLFGGQRRGGFVDPDDQTWEWDGNDWKKVAGTGPSGRRDHAMTYNPHRGVCVLFGGVMGGSERSSETWEWDGATWSLISAGGLSPRDKTALAYDAARRELVLCGGNDDDGVISETHLLRCPGCTGRESIMQAECMDGRLVVLMKRSVPADRVWVTLSDGTSKSKEVNPHGKARVQFNNRPAGDSGLASAEWGCGAVDEKEYVCP
ncbi:MAG: hypothetical protein FLDDKLPJ_03553 [Phycisphaerae bacterium]|nr:hypothetical protein [Phycisphaerae bacterium]